MTSIIASFIALSLLSASEGSSPAPCLDGVSSVCADVYLPMKLEEGTWDADVTYYSDNKPTEHDTGVQVNELFDNGHWITNDFRIAASSQYAAYQGHGVWGFDPVAKTYVDTWIDSNDLSVRTDYGFWLASTNTMVWSSKQNDGEGHFVDYRMVEEFKGEKRSLAIYQLGLADAVEHLLIKMEFARRKIAE